MTRLDMESGPQVGAHGTGNAKCFCWRHHVLKKLVMMGTVTGAVYMWKLAEEIF